MRGPERVQARMRKKFAGCENGASRMRLMPSQLKKSVICYSFFSLCIGMQWLFWGEPRNLRAEEGEKQSRANQEIGVPGSGTVFVRDSLTDERTAVAVRMSELPDPEGFPRPSSWELAAPLRFDADWQGRHGDPERE